MSNYPNLGKEPIIIFRKEVKMSKLWDLLKESVITQALVTLILTGTVCYLAVTGQPVPDLIAYGFTGVLGYFFGVKTQQALRR